jgi:hypothetical protein
MNAPAIVSSPMAVTAVRTWISPIDSPPTKRCTVTLVRSPSTVDAFDGLALALLPTNASQGTKLSSYSTSTCCLPRSHSHSQSAPIDRKSCLKKTTPHCSASESESKRSRSVSFVESVRVRFVPYTASATRIRRLWYQDADYNRFRLKIQKLAVLAKSYKKQHGKSVNLVGMEKWIVEEDNPHDNDEECECPTQVNATSSSCSRVPTTYQLRSQAFGSVLMEQFFQQQKGIVSEERIAALYRLSSTQAQALAWERAAKWQISDDEHDDDDKLTRSLAKVTTSATIQ